MWPNWAKVMTENPALTPPPSALEMDPFELVFYLFTSVCERHTACVKKHISVQHSEQKCGALTLLNIELMNFCHLDDDVCFVELEFWTLSVICC